MIERMREILIEIRQRLRRNKERIHEGRIEYKDGHFMIAYIRFDGVEMEIGDDSITMRPAGWRAAENIDERLIKQYFEDEAKRLAARDYAYVVERDVFKGRPIYTAEHIEFPNGAASGRTEDEAKANLDLGRVDWIYRLLEEGRPIPAPLGDSDE